MRALFFCSLFVALDLFAQLPREALGPSSRRAPIAISEIMYKPAARTDGLNTEYIELYNSNPWSEDISRFRLDGLVKYTFPPNTQIPAQSFVVVAADPSAIQSVYGLSSVFGPYTNSLKASGLIQLYSEQNALLLEINYDDVSPWPMGASGTGHSIVLARASYGENDPRAWDRSEKLGGSPNAPDATAPSSALRSISINELLIDSAKTDSIELYNHSTNSVNLGGCVLTDDVTSNKFIIPANKLISPGSFVSFSSATLGFRLNPAGQTLYLRAVNGFVLDALKYGPLEEGVSFGRYPDGSPDWSRLNTQTLGKNNAQPLISPVGINEIMYKPISGVDDDQYVELFNQSAAPISLAGWKFVAGISFTFPSNTVIPSKGYLVIGRDAKRLQTNYAQLTPANCIGNFSGKLSGKGERLALAKPGVVLTTNSSGATLTNQVEIVVDEVTYGTGGRWGRWADGGGSSLELIDCTADKRVAGNWADSDETAKSAWTTVELTGNLDLGNNTPNSSCNFAQIGLLDAGECLIDDVEIIPAESGNNVVDNGTFDNGAAGWTFFGDHCRSTVDTDVGYPAGGSALHIRTADSIWPGGNSVQASLTATLTPNTVATLRFKGRWLRGCPEPLFRVAGNWLDVAGRLPVPANLGTPGLPNSQGKTSVGPLIHHVTHSPALPSAGQTVAVTAQLSNPSLLTSFQLNYRVDPGTTNSTVTMRDDGTAGDAVAHDGVFTGLIPGQSAQTLVAFTLQAADSNGITNRFPELLADNAPIRECVVGFGEPNPSMDFGAYHVWLTKTNVNRLVALPVMSNEDVDSTLVYGNRVIYNMGLHYGGSPWHQNYDSPVGSRACHYIWKMPEDDRLLGASSFNKIHWPGNDIQNDTSTSNRDDPTIQREQTANLFLRALGLPWINRRYVAVYVNGGRRGTLMEDSLRPSSSVRDEYFPDDTDAQLFKVQPWYEMSRFPNGNRFGFQNNSWCYLDSYMSEGSWKPTRYRWCWQLRQSDSMSNLTNVYSLVTAAEAVSTNIDALENVADMENWMRLMAVNHAVGNWDSFGTESGQNVYGWVSAQRRWTLFMFDLSICLGNAIARQPGANLFTAIDPTWQKIYAAPKYRRMYCRALKELVNGVMSPENVNPIVEAKYSAFVNAGFSKLSSPTGIESWIASAKSSIATQLVAEDTPAFTLTVNNTLSATSNSAYLTGTAPLEAVTILVNGNVVNPAWTSTKAWSVYVPVPYGVSTCTVEAYDRFGNPVGSTLSVTVKNPSAPESPVGKIVFNEIMFNGPTDAQYVEIYNRSTNTTFDLSDWTINGLGYTFPPGSTIAPGRFLVLAKSRTVFANTYNPLIPVFDQFDGALQIDGETLTLVQPGTPEVVIDRVRYESTAPWPDLAATPAGASLQLVDAAQDNSRVANWKTGILTPAATNSVVTSLPPFPTLWLNEVQPENLAGNVDNFGERDPWIELYNPGSSPVSLDNFYLSPDYATPTQWAFPSNTTIAPGQFLVVWCDGQSNQNSEIALHTNFRLTPGTGSVSLYRLLLSSKSVQIVDYLNYADLPANHTYGDFPDGQPFYREAMFYASPGASNNTVLPPVTVFINEWMAQNTGFPKDPLTFKFEDWFELYNPSDTPADLSSYYLTDSLDSPFQYQIPAGYRVPAHGFLMVWADGQTSVYDASDPELHVPFNLSVKGEAIGLFTPLGVAVDAVTFPAQSANISEGRYPDGGSLRLFMSSPSPAAPNILPPATNALAFTAISLQPGGPFELSFQTSPGHTYRVEYTDDLTSPEWLPVGEDSFAVAQTLTIRAAAESAQRFYRLVLVK